MAALFAEGCGRGVDGTFWCFSPPYPPTPTPALNGALDWSPGGFFSGFLGSEPIAFDCVVLADKMAACEGSDDGSQLGILPSSAPSCQYDCTGFSYQKMTCEYPCENTPRVMPGVGPASHVMGQGGPCALQSDGAVMCWGDVGSSVALTPQKIALPDRAVAIGGGTGSCAVLASGELACWSFDAGGPIDRTKCPSTGCPSPAVVPGLSHLVGLSITFDHGCALRDDGAAFCWGQNLAGGLGDGTAKDSVTPVQVVTSSKLVQVSTSLGISCAVTQDAHVVCWGVANAQSGVDGASSCDGAGFGCRLVPFEVPGLNDVKQVSAALQGEYLAFALKTDGTVVAIGETSSGFTLMQVAP